MAAGLDKETLDMTVEAVREFAGRELTKEKLLEFDEKDVFPEAIIRDKKRYSLKPKIETLLYVGMTPMQVRLYTGILKRDNILPRTEKELPAVSYTSA